MKSDTICEQIMTELLVEQDYQAQYTRKQVEKAIMKVRGIDERTVQRWLKALMVFEYLEPKAPNIYSINFVKVPKFVLEALKQSNGQTRIG